MAITLDSPLALYYIPAAWLVAFYPAAMKTNVLRSAKLFNNAQPRGAIEKAKGKLPEDVILKVQRMDGAHTNGQEMFPLWVAALFSALYAKLDNRTVNVLGLSFLGLRVAYNTVYINQKTHAQGNVRSLVWLTGLAVPFTLLIKSANKLVNA